MKRIDDIERFIGNRKNTVTAFDLRLQAVILKKSDGIITRKAIDRAVHKARIRGQVCDKGLVIAEVGDITAAFAGDRELSTDAGVLFKERDIRSRFSRRACRHHTRGPCSDDDDPFIRHFSRPFRIGSRHRRSALSKLLQDP